MTENMKWTREPKSSYISDELIEIVTEPHTDLWQRTYYHFRNDNAPVLQMEADEKYFSSIVKTDFTDSHRRFDQCGIVSAAVRTIIVLNAPMTVRTSLRCVCVICGRAKAGYGSAFTLAVPKIRALRQYLPI